VEEKMLHHRMKPGAMDERILGLSLGRGTGRACAIDAIRQQSIPISMRVASFVMVNIMMFEGC
jgi:hypothetical protein